jgi:tetratricopeptide (TPR) repeat protein
MRYNRAESTFVSFDRSRAALPLGEKPLPFTKSLLGAGLAVATFLTYCRCLDHPFSNYDDPAYVFDNPHVLAGLTRDGISWAFTTFHFATWHPMTWMSLQLDCTLYGGAKAQGFHITNLLLHISSVLLLFLFLDRFTGRVWPSAIVAALMALHPQHVETVAWISERKGVLCGFFWMLSLTAYGAYVRRPGVGRYLLTALALTVGLMAKAMIVTLPCVLLLLDYWPLGRWQRGPKPARADGPQPVRLSLSRLVLEKAPLFALVLLGSVLAFLSQSRIGAVASLEQFPMTVRIDNALLAYVGYIGKMLWPLNLAVYYPHEGDAISRNAVLLAACALIGVTLFVLGPGRRWPYLAVGWLWYLGTLVPVIGLVQLMEHASADRYSYLPSIGLYLMLTWGVADGMRVCLPRLAPFVAAVVVLGTCVVLSWTQLGYWANDLLLWQHAAAITRENATTCTNLGNALYTLDRREPALTEYRKAVRLNPRYTPALYHLGKILLDLGRPDEAVSQMLQIPPHAPEYRMARGKLSQFCYQQGLLDLARSQLEEVVSLEPDSAAARLDLGLVLRDQGELEEAGTEFERAVQLDPTNIQAQAALAQTLLDLGRYEEAETITRQVLARLPADHPWHGPLKKQRQICRQRQDLEQRLPAVLEKKDKPASPSELLALAEICQNPHTRRYADAALLYSWAFADPALDESLRQQYRYPAVRTAALAGTGNNVARLEAALTEHWRRMAQEWMRADLELFFFPAGQRSPVKSGLALRRLKRWQRDPALATLREADAQAQWSAGERENWQRLWRDLESILAQPENARDREAERLLSAETKPGI